MKSPVSRIERNPDRKSPHPRAIVCVKSMFGIGTKKEMELMSEVRKIESFKADHDKIEPGIYISRTDGDLITYDMRTRKPNCGNYMDNITMHTVEHMFATYVRSSEIGDSVIYFGPMGCQTGFYLIVKDTQPQKVLSVVKSVLQQIIDHEGPVFGAERKECGNYRNLALEPCVEECRRYLDVLNSKAEVDFKYAE